MTSATAARADSTERSDVIRQANRLWRRAGVHRTDRQLLLTELETELRGAYQDGHSPTSILGEDSDQMLRSWAHERGMCGRALRLGLVVPSALAGIVVGLAAVLLVLVASFRGWSGSFDPGRLRFVLSFYASGAALAFLCALLCVWGALRYFGDPCAASTVRWLAALLPIGAALSTGAGVAVAWWRNFNTSTPVFVAVTGLVIVGLVLTVGLARYLAVRTMNDTGPESL
ncbi:hypothetical protein DEU38_117132 [Rhodococcus sp. AG1013]|uniref:hypothetical protein n=1 Tax=Rhodococcus sp. AG1013 TaxID=2183996 RepID=UPI000E0A0A2B|nr:hypothetical protein [Rhodococcus sp. AG1013]RDI20020.1 hypothetical protein DEU38_117132 [Rhodococcus sp. AG1013]